MSQENNNKKQKRAFSKTLLIQESVLIWIMTLVFLYLAYLCIETQFSASLPWLAAMVSFPWGAYCLSSIFYYKKSQAENTKDGLVFEKAINEFMPSETKSIYNDVMNKIDVVDELIGEDEENTSSNVGYTSNVRQNVTTTTVSDLNENFDKSLELNNCSVLGENQNITNPDPEGPI